MNHRKDDEEIETENERIDKTTDKLAKADIS